MTSARRPRRAKEKRASCVFESDRLTPPAYPRPPPTHAIAPPNRFRRCVSEPCLEMHGHRTEFRYVRDLELFCRHMGEYRTLRVFIANFGRENYEWPECRRRVEKDVARLRAATSCAVAWPGSAASSISIPRDRSSSIGGVLDEEKHNGLC